MIYVFIGIRYVKSLITYKSIEFGVIRFWHPLDSNQESPISYKLAVSSENSPSKVIYPNILISLTFASL